MRKIMSLVLALVLLFTNVGFGETISEYVRALANSISIELNGQIVEGDNLLYEETIYVPLKIMTEMFGGEVKWNPNTRTASVVLLNDAQIEKSIVSEKIIELKYFNNPVVSYTDLGVRKSDIYSIAFEDNADSVEYRLEPDGLHWQKSLSLNESQEFMIIKKDGTFVTRTLVTRDLPEIIQTADSQLIYVPANPAKGFNFPYMLRIPGTVTSFGPSAENRKYITEKKYIVMDSTNSGSDEPLDWVTEMLTELPQNSVSTADHFGYPTMVPILPRTSVRVEQDKFGYSYLYEHSLDRDSVYVRELTTTDSNKSRNLANFEYENVDPTLFYDLDNQVKAMTEHAVKYLNANGFGVEEKVILMGFSATGSFVERFANLHPESVAMMISGGSNDDMILPTDKYKGETLSYPVGVADYKAITGQEFDLDIHNSVARLYYMGKKDTNNVVGYSDCYFEYTNNQIDRLFGRPILPRAIANANLYGESGGTGMFVLMTDKAHGHSSAMTTFIREFIEANADSDTPVYMKPTSSTLETTIFE